MAWYERTEIILGHDNIEKLKRKHIAIFGVGGVGGYVCEGLARVGIGEFDIIDNDVVDETNINRQIIALTSTIGKNKVDVMKDRLIDINPSVKVNQHKVFFSDANKDIFPFDKYDYIVDAIDSVESKLTLIKFAKEKNINMISAMGAGFRLDGERFKVANIKDTKVCPLAKKIRTELRKSGINDLKVVYSDEEPKKDKYVDSAIFSNGIGSISYAPAIMGLLIAETVIKDLLIVP